MILRHATTKQNLNSIQASGLRLAHADPTAKIRGVWLHTASQSAWATVHTMRKHHSPLEEVVIIEVRVPRRQLRHFRAGLWYVQGDVLVDQLTGRQWDGAAFGAPASE